MPPDLTPLEAAALALLLAGDEPELVVLRAQLAVARILQCERTGVGFFAHFEVPTSVPSLGLARRVVLDDVRGELRGLDRAAGFLLLVDDGRLSMLEGFSYGESWPASDEVHELSYLGAATTGLGTSSLVPTGSRDRRALRRCLDGLGQGGPAA